MFDPSASAEDPSRGAFGQLLLRFRLAAGLTQAELAKLGCISVFSISALERGVRRAPYRHTVGLIADALGLNAADRAALTNAAIRPHRPLRHRLGDPQALLHNLPPETTPFVGRSGVLAELQTLVKREQLVTLAGAGGVGKTRTAARIASLMCSGFPDGVWLIELASLSEGARIADAIMAAIGGIGQGPVDVEEAVLAFLRRKQLLLVMDNCEHLLRATARIVQAILHTAPGVRILATSREQLNIPEERVFQLPSLSVPPKAETLTAEAALAYEAVELFVARAKTVDAHFSLSNETASTIADICRRLDGIALALELAAAHVSALGPRQLLALLDERFRLLTTGDRTMPTRHQTLRALIDWSFDQLGEREQALLLGLSVFAGSWTLDAVTAICNDPKDRSSWDVIRCQRSLIDKSLVITESSQYEQRYRLLESTREYALEKLAARDETRTLAQRHATWYHQWSGQIKSAREAMGEEMWLAAVAAEFDNVLAALQWCLGKRNDVRTGTAIAASLDRYWMVARLQEGRYWLSAALKEPEIDEDPPLAAEVMLALAGCSTPGLERLAAAKEATKRARALQNAPLLGRALTRQGTALFEIGQLDECEGLLPEALMLHRNADYPEGVAAALRLFGQIWRFQGNIDRARETYRRSLDLYEASGCVCVPAGIRSDLAELAFSCGETDRAIALASEARDVSARLNDQRTIGTTEANLAGYLIAADRWTAASVHAEAALRRFCDWAPLQYRIIAIEHLAVIAGLTGDTARAAQLFGYTDTQINTLGKVRTPTEERGRQRLAPILSARFDSRELAERLARGARMSEAEAIAEALRDKKAADETPRVSPLPMRDRIIAQRASRARDGVQSHGIRRAMPN